MIVKDSITLFKLFSKNTSNSGNKFYLQINNDWKTVSHTLVFETAATFTESLKKAHNSKNLINILFGYNCESLFEKYKIRLLVHEESLGNSNNKNSKTKMTAQERHLMEEIKRMQGSRNFELIVGCEVSYGMDFVILPPSTPEKNECITQVRIEILKPAPGS